MTERLDVIREHLVALYGESRGDETFRRLRELLDRPHPPPAGARTPAIPSPTYPPRPPFPKREGENPLPPRSAGEGGEITHRDAILITYGDQVGEPGVAPLRTLADFCRQHLSGLISSIHILPFFPYSSDDGFAVIDYRAVNPALGAWEDVRAIGGVRGRDRRGDSGGRPPFRLMFDAVINHVSAQSEWFRRFLQDDPAYRDYFIVVEGDPDLSQVVRPRALPLLTRVATPSGQKAVWTTFSADQIDLNYSNPDVLLEIIATLLFYAAQGAEFIRLDAVAFLWKEIGTPCIHLPQTHRVIRLLRAALDAVAPHVLLITETNVPHLDNISYFGDGANEAQMVYNFALPPLTLHALHSGDARALSEWAAGLKLPSGRTTFFNFLASHDGVGLNPARGILAEAEIEALVPQVRAQGGLVSYKANSDGSESPYELNVNYFDALSGPHGGDPPATQVDRFMTAQAIKLALVGLPGIYFHSLFGSRGWPEGVKQTGRNRTINRQKLERAALERELADPTSLRYQVFQRHRQLLAARAGCPAFHPYGRQQVVDCGEAIFGLLRSSPSGRDRALCLHNVSERPQKVAISLKGLGARTASGLLDRAAGFSQRVHTTLRPYQTLWLQLAE